VLLGKSFSQGSLEHDLVLECTNTKSGKQYWMMDEFCAIFDRDTAKIVALLFMLTQPAAACFVAFDHSTPRGNNAT